MTKRLTHIPRLAALPALVLALIAPLHAQAAGQTYDDGNAGVVQPKGTLDGGPYNPDATTRSRMTDGNGVAPQPAPSGADRVRDREQLRADRQAARDQDRANRVALRRQRQEERNGAWISVSPDNGPGYSGSVDVDRSGTGDGLP